MRSVGLMDPLVACRFRGQIVWFSILWRGDAFNVCKQSCGVCEVQIWSMPQVLVYIHILFMRPWIRSGIHKDKRTILWKLFSFLLYWERFLAGCPAVKESKWFTHLSGGKLCKLSLIVFRSGESTDLGRPNVLHIPTSSTTVLKTYVFNCGRPPFVGPCRVKMNLHPLLLNWFDCTSSWQ